MDLGSRGIVLSVVAKTKTLISFAVTAKLICVFVFAYAKRLFSRDAADFAFYSVETYVVGASILMSTHNIGFY